MGGHQAIADTTAVNNIYMPSFMGENTLEAFLESSSQLCASSSHTPHLSSPWHFPCLLSLDHGHLKVMGCGIVAQGALCPQCAEEACTEEGGRKKSRWRWLRIGFWVPWVPLPLILFVAISPKFGLSLQPVTETGIRSHPVLPGLGGSGPSPVFVDSPWSARNHSLTACFSQK